jgi:outer membrane protein TolC
MTAILLGLPAAAAQAPAATAPTAAAPEQPGAPSMPLPSAEQSAALPSAEQDPASQMAPLRGQPALPDPALPVPAADRPIRLSPNMAITGKVTYSRAVALALALNPAIARADAGLLDALGGLGEANALRLPTFGADAGNRTYSPGVNEYRDGKEVKEDAQDIPTAGVTATLPIDIAGDLRAASDQAHFAEVAARLDINKARNDVVANVGDAFYGVLRARALLKVAQENLTDSLTSLDDANKKFRSRTVAILDVVRAQTDVANAKQQLIIARSNVALTISALNGAIGLAVDTPIDVSEEGAVVAPAGVVLQSATTPPNTQAILAAANAEAAELQNGTMAAPSPQESPTTPDGATLSANENDTTNIADPLAGDRLYESMAAEAIQTRPEILDGDARIAAAKHGVEYAKRSILPSVQVGVRYDYAPVTSGTSVVLNNTQTFVGLVFPLYDAGQAHAREQEARARETDAVVARRQAVDAVTLDVRQSYLDLLQARDRVSVANQALTQARETYQIALIRYTAGVTSRAGLSPLLESSDAQAALVQAETAEVDALYDYNRARVDLNHAIGRYSYTAVGPGYPVAPPSKVVGR